MIDVYDMEGEADREQITEILDGALRLCGEYEDLLSRTREGSDIFRINNAGGKSVTCDGRTIELIKKGIYYGDLSAGKFDITVGCLSELWDFHAEKPKLPSKEDIQEALKHVDYSKVEINGENNSVVLKDPEMMLDLGGIAKGYIADRICDHLIENGVTSAVISLGGNVVCIGNKVLDGKEMPFKVGIETPYSDRTEISKTIEMSDETAVTSGVYERFIEVDGIKYHHIIDPKTGYPADTDLLSATVVSKTGNSCDADALSTVCLMLGNDGARELIGNLDGYEGYFISDQ